MVVYLFTIWMQHIKIVGIHRRRPSSIQILSKLSCFTVLTDYWKIARIELTITNDFPNGSTHNWSTVVSRIDLKHYQSRDWQYSENTLIYECLTPLFLATWSIRLSLRQCDNIATVDYFFGLPFTWTFHTEVKLKISSFLHCTHAH